MTKKENVLEKCRINLDKEKVLHSITRGERDKYKERIDKAIEYIEDFWKKNSYYEDVDNCMMYCLSSEYDKGDLLKILKGEDKE